MVIAGQRASIRKAVLLQDAANNIVSVVSADDIGALPDINAAEALARRPGISVQRDEGEGRYVSVRGLGPDLKRVPATPLAAIFTIWVHCAAVTWERRARRIEGACVLRSRRGGRWPGRCALSRIMVVPRAPARPILSVRHAAFPLRYLKRAAC